MGKFSFIQAKSILSRMDDRYFGLSYNMNLYRGCQHGCIYCDSRSLCYQLSDLSDIRVKQNAIELLRTELSSKRKKGTVGFGSMNDPYMPIEAELHLTRKALQLMCDFRFPVHIITKSDLVLRDLDLLKQISSQYACVSFSFSTPLDSLAIKTEPGASLPSKRFEAIKKLSEAGIYCGICLMPVLPFINDTEKQIRTLIAMAAEAGAKYILPFLGVTLREGSREFFLDKLDSLNPAIAEKYRKYYNNSYECHVPQSQQLYRLIEEECAKYNIATAITPYIQDEGEQLSLF